MAKAQEQGWHHWWPIGLQKYWADKDGNISSVKPDGTTEKKKVKNEKIGRKRHGHTIFKNNNFWRSNFEDEFTIDNHVHSIVSGIRSLKPFGRTPFEFFSMIMLLRKKDRSLRDFCKFYHCDEKLHRNLLLLLYSLLIRSPANRSRYESYPRMVGLPPDEDIGKANMAQNYRIAKKLCQNSSISNQFFVILHSPMKKFICGDGCLDWLTDNLVGNSIRGRALVPITPHICIYFCTPMSMGMTKNCASISVAPWMVDWVNNITQIYSKGKLFYLGKPPQLIDAFRQHEFLEYEGRTDAFLDMLDDIVGNLRPHSLFSMNGF